MFYDIIFVLDFVALHCQLLVLRVKASAAKKKQVAVPMSGGVTVPHV